MRGAPEPSLDRAALPAATLAAVAESGVLLVAVRSVALDSGITAGPMLSYPAYAALFTGSVAAATRWRRSPAGRVLLPAAALVLGVAQGTVWGPGGGPAVAAGVALALLTAVRVAALALRDWREPVSGSFGLGLLALFLEVVMLGGEPGTSRLLASALPLFVLGSLASRAVSVRLALPVLEPAPERRAVALGRRIGPASLVLGALAALIAAALALGGPGGGFQLAGRAVWGGASWVLVAVGYVLALLLLGPLRWALARLHLDVDWLRVASDRLRHVGPGRGVFASAPGGVAVSRLVGLVAFVVVSVLLWRSLRRRFARLVPAERREEAPVPPPRAVAGGRRRRPRVRRELPEDTVRRWYAEALLVLEGLGLPKPPSRTPGEYLREVVRAFPACAAGFTALTRAYEDVRYGGRSLDPRTLLRVEAERELAMRALREARRIDDQDQA